ncbi:MAG: hypothetical protein A2X94_16600 [Bdellovibrionales bacterium GWB1_55_8]|nr:MAG: hypothetical protein A2X94_16600 [Bdellovibrionales bacterium GWB1_55_8]
MLGFVSVLFAIGFAGSAFAAASYFPTYGSSYVRCEAFTTCPNGMPIRCWAYGNSYNYTACTWSVIPGAYVECTGFNDWGQWAVSWARCY